MPLSFCVHWVSLCIATSVKTQQCNVILVNILFQCICMNLPSFLLTSYSLDYLNHQMTLSSLMYSLLLMMHGYLILPVATIFFFHMDNGTHDPITSLSSLLIMLTVSPPWLHLFLMTTWQVDNCVFQVSTWLVLAYHVVLSYNASEVRVRRVMQTFS